MQIFLQWLYRCHKVNILQNFFFLIHCIFFIFCSQSLKAFGYYHICIQVINNNNIGELVLSLVPIKCGSSFKVCYLLTFLIIHLNQKKRLSSYRRDFLFINSYKKIKMQLFILLMQQILFVETTSLVEAQQVVGELFLLHGGIQNSGSSPSYYQSLSFQFGSLILISFLGSQFCVYH